MASTADDRIAELAAEDAVAARLQQTGNRVWNGKSSETSRDSVHQVDSTESKAAEASPLMGQRTLNLGERVFSYAPEGPYDVTAIALSAQYVPTSRPLVPTKGTVVNLCKVMDAVNAQAPILLEGTTGAGKSATVTELARQLGRPLIRLNLSSKTTISGLLGGVTVKTENSTLRPTFALGPFTVAFRYGFWLLLDEMNLAPGTC